MKLLVILGNLTNPKKHERSIGIKECGRLADDILVPLEGKYCLHYYPDRFSCTLKQKKL